MKLLLLVLIALASASVMSSPQSSYLLHCGGCHLPDGRGIPPEVPSLRNELGKLIQIPGGRDYLVRVPGASQAPISDGELAQVLNYVLREFNRETLHSDFTPLGAEEVSKSRPHILADPLKYRARLWADYN